jgi:hypothetical protein
MSTPPPPSRGRPRIRAIHIENFRSIGPTGVTLTPLAKVNVLVGANCSGKTNILLAVNALCKSEESGRPTVPADCHRRDPSRPPSLVLDVSHSNPAVAELLQTLPDTKVKRFYQSGPRGSNGGYKTEYSLPGTLQRDNERRTEIARLLSGSRPVASYREEPGLAQGEFAIDKVMPKVVFIPAVGRGATPAANAREVSPSGQGMPQVVDLARNARVEDRSKYPAVSITTGAIREALGDPNAEMLAVADSRDRLSVSRDGLTFSIDEHGLGLGQLAVLTWHVATAGEKWLLVEDPDLHLHARQQYDLVERMLKGDGMYFLTTHSSVFLEPRDGVQVFRVEYVSSETRVTAVDDGSSRTHVMADLGIRPSSLLLSNFVVWVEGPSDRYYLRHWLKIVDPDLLEHRHYSFQYFAGSNLAHMSFTDDETTGGDFLKALHFARHCAVVVDSDREAEVDELKPYVRRIQSECQKGSMLCWVTAGREIENYLPEGVVIDAYKSRGKPAPDEHATWGRYQKMEMWLQSMFGAKGEDDGHYSSRKPSVARSIVERVDSSHTDILDLKDRLTELVNAIRRANGLRT